MKLKVIMMDGSELELECTSFEFSANHESNYLKTEDGNCSYRLCDVAVIKANEPQESEDKE